MTAQVSVLALVEEFVNCFTSPGFAHFTHFILAHAALWAAPHCVTETFRFTLWHHIKHWTTPYVFMRRGRWSCGKISQKLLEIITGRLFFSKEMILAIDDTLVKKWGKNFFGLGCYPDPTDKNPGGSRRRVWGHSWVVLALLWEKGPGKWFCFPLSTLLFVPQLRCPPGWPFLTKIDLAVELLRRLNLFKRPVVVVDNLYAKLKLLEEVVLQGGILVSRLRSNAALYEPPKKREKGKRGRPTLRGEKHSPKALWRRSSKRKRLMVHIYGRTVTLTAFVNVVVPSRCLGATPILVVIFPQRSGKKMNVFFTTDLTMSPERVLELYGARFKIEDAFDELKTNGGFGDYRQRSFRTIKRHVTLCLVSYSLLRVLSLTLRGAEQLEAEPWWHPTGPPSVTRMRRACAKAFAISCSLHSRPKVKEIYTLKKAA